MPEDFLKNRPSSRPQNPGGLNFATSDDVSHGSEGDMNMKLALCTDTTRSERAVAAGALSQLGAPAWGRRDAAALTQDGYLRNAVVGLIAWRRGLWKLLEQLAGAAPGTDWRPPVPNLADGWCAGGLVADCDTPRRAVLAQPARTRTTGFGSRAGAGRAGGGTGANVLRAYFQPARRLGRGGSAGRGPMVRASSGELDWPWTGARLGSEVAATLALEIWAGLPWECGRTCGGQATRLQ